MIITTQLYREDKIIEVDVEFKYIKNVPETHDNWGWSEGIPAHIEIENTFDSKTGVKVELSDKEYEKIEKLCWKELEDSIL